MAACGGDDDAEPAPADAAESEPAAESAPDASGEVETTASEPDAQPAAAGGAAGINDLRSFEPGTSQIGSVTVDGRTATGTATFIDASLDVRSCRGEHLKSGVAGPLEERSQIVAVSVEGAARVAGKKRSRSQLRL